MGGEVVGQVVHDLVVEIGIAVLVASILSYLFNLLRLPLILAYLATGVVIGTQLGFGFVSTTVGLNSISEIGLVLMLFMIGLEIDLNKLKVAGASLAVAGVLQFVISTSLALGVFVAIGYGVGGGSFDALYLAIGVALSSTAVVVKLLYNKNELDTLSGRLTIGILIFQDIWAIVFLGVQPNLQSPQLGAIALTFCTMTLLIGTAVIVSKTLLPYLFKRIAKLPELIILASLGWCIALCGLAAWMGLSVELGALIAGVGMSSFPYTLDVEAKLGHVRDVFVLLFFVSLGLMIPNPFLNLNLVLVGFGTVVIVFGTRFVSVYPILKTFRQGNRVGLLTSLNLSNVSEFALVIATIGFQSGHVSSDVLTVLIYAFVIGSVCATLMSAHTDRIQGVLSKHILEKVGLGDSAAAQPQAPGEESRDIAFIGFFNTASSMIEEMKRIETETNTNNLLSRSVVIDFNPSSHDSLRSMGVSTKYGDVSHLDTLRHAGIAHVKVAVSTIPDNLLVGTNNARIVEGLRLLCPQAKIIATAESIREALVVYEAGADYVIVPRVILSQHVTPTVGLLLDAANGQYDAQSRASVLREEHVQLLQNRTEILS